MDSTAGWGGQPDSIQRLFSSIINNKWMKHQRWSNWTKLEFQWKETDLTGAELVDQQRASLRVLSAVEAVQLSGHLIQLFVGVVELSQELRVCPLRKHKDA